VVIDCEPVTTSQQVATIARSAPAVDGAGHEQPARPRREPDFPLENGTQEHRR
jgi:hypothetical protein